MLTNPCLKALLILFLFLAICPGSLAAQEQSGDLSGSEECSSGTSPEGLPNAQCSVELNAAPETVWKAIQERRSSDPQHRKLVSYDGRKAVVKEQFPAAPVIGATSCTYEEKEKRREKEIDYKMIDSSRFQKFEGCWQLESGAKANSTKVSLTATLDPGMRFPFWDRIARATLVKNLKHTLAEVVHIVKSDTSK